MSHYEFSNPSLVEIEHRIEYEFHDVRNLTTAIAEFAQHYLDQVVVTFEDSSANFPFEVLSSTKIYKRLSEYKQRLADFFQPLSLSTPLLVGSEFREEALKYLLSHDKIYYSIFNEFNTFYVFHLDSEDEELRKIETIFLLHAMIIDCNTGAEKAALAEWIQDHFFKNMFFLAVDLINCGKPDSNINNVVSSTVHKYLDLQEESEVREVEYLQLLQDKENLLKADNAKFVKSLSTRQNMNKWGFNEIVLNAIGNNDFTYPTDPILTVLDPDQDRKSYFEQFKGYILAEIIAAVAAQKETIEKKNLTPFQVQILKGKSKSGTGSVCISGEVLRKDLPKLDHGFVQEIVMIAFKDRNRPFCVFGIANIQSETTDPEDIDESEEKIQKIKITLFSKDQEQIIRSLPCDRRIDVHWLHGILPDYRMFTACENMPKTAFEDQFLRGALPAWPEPNSREEMKDYDPCLQVLNANQKNSVTRLASAREGIYFLQGPPGTGKTTTVAALVMQLLRQHPNKRILICAPTNQALRNLLQYVRRLSPKADMALIGVGKDIPEELHDFYVHGFAKRIYQHLIQIKRDLIAGKGSVQAVKKAISQSLAKLPPKLKEAEIPTFVQNVSYWNSLHEEIRVSCEAVAEESSEAAMIAGLEKCIRILQSNSTKIEEFLVKRAQVVFATLISSGRPWLQKQITLFDIVILDEAAQALVPAALIPLKFNPSLYIQVGDPQQLPATITSQVGKAHCYADSMMHRLVTRAGGVHEMLRVQYRMHPDICRWINTKFYGGALVNDESVTHRPCILQDNRQLNSDLKHPSLFFDIRNGEENRFGSEASATISNKQEAKAIVDMACYLVFRCRIRAEDIGIISFYNGQISLISKYLQEEKTKGPRGKYLQGVKVHTVDGFQGGERKIILVSVVRTCKSVGFLKDERRLNVCMSRAQNARWVFGNLESLEHSDSILPSLVSEHQENDKVIKESDFYSIIKTN